jgi:hypothetical protein
MKDIFNPYLSNDEKDILWEIKRLEEEYAAIPDNTELWKFPTVSSALPG